MEPLNCTVKLDGDKAELWMGTQMPGLDAMAAAKVLGLQPQNVKVHTQMAGGGFGRRAIPTSDYVVEACGVAKAARTAGITAPCAPCGAAGTTSRAATTAPCMCTAPRSALTPRGNILAWDHVIVGQSILKGSPFEAFMVKNGVDATAVEGMKEPYNIPMRLSVHHPQVNVPVLWWRSVGSTHTAYAMETLLDEVARATSKTRGLPPAPDGRQAPPPQGRSATGGGPVGLRQKEARRRPRLGRGGARVVPARWWLMWWKPPSAKTARPKLHSVTAGVHCNLAVNPKSVEAQVQGGR